MEVSRKAKRDAWEHLEYKCVKFKSDAEYSQIFFEQTALQIYAVSPEGKVFIHRQGRSAKNI